MIIVGSSNSGKTYLVRQMILRRDFCAKKSELEIIVLSPVEASVKQIIWKDLAARGYSVKGIHCTRGGGFTLPPLGKKKRLIVADDVDHIADMRFQSQRDDKPRNGREWLLDLFGTESHHTNISVVLICHHLSIGCPTIRNSTDAVVVTSLPPARLHGVCKDLGVDGPTESKILKALADDRGRLPSERGGKFIVLYNHVVIFQTQRYRRSCDGGVLERAPTLFRFGYNVSDAPGLREING